MASANISQSTYLLFEQKQSSANPKLVLQMEEKISEKKYNKIICTYASGENNPYGLRYATLTRTIESEGLSPRSRGPTKETDVRKFADPRTAAVDSMIERVIELSGMADEGGKVELAKLSSLSEVGPLTESLETAIYKFCNIEQK